MQKYKYIYKNVASKVVFFRFLKLCMLDKGMIILLIIKHYNKKLIRYMIKGEVSLCKNLELLHQPQTVNFIPKLSNTNKIKSGLMKGECESCSHCVG